jgi:hypothetical protein
LGRGDLGAPPQVLDIVFQVFLGRHYGRG